MTIDVDGPLSLRGRRALITGASLGIGRAIARVMAQRGASIALHHASAIDAAMGYPRAGRLLAGELEASGTTVAVIDRDLVEQGAGTQVVEAAARALGGVDVLVIAASVQQSEPFERVTDASVERQVRIDFAATVELLQAVLPLMASQRFGRIVSIGSVNQVRPRPDLRVYAALKAAQHNLIVGIAKEHAALDITANTISPGLIATPRNDARRVDPEEWRRMERAANPMGRAGTPEEVAPLAALLAAPAGAFITGADIAVDGGGRLP